MLQLRQNRRFSSVKEIWILLSTLYHNLILSVTLYSAEKALTSRFLGYVSLAAADSQGCIYIRTLTFCLAEILPFYNLTVFSEHHLFKKQIYKHLLYHTTYIYTAHMHTYIRPMTFYCACANVGRYKTRR